MCKLKKSRQAVLRSIVGLISFLAAAACAASQWAILPESSSVEFSVAQQADRVRGRFDVFSATIDLDPNEPSKGKIVGIVEPSSVDTGNEERDLVLLDRDWFDAGNWPVARFESERIEAVGGVLRAYGQLTVKGRTERAIMDFSFKVTDTSNAQLSGTMTVQRLAFGIGEGDWADTERIGNDVTIQVALSLTK
jgi:polyisoprenoid-binding protein YceI